MSASKQWTVNCRDARGSRRALGVFPDGSGVTMVLPDGNSVSFSPLEVGRLRAALRDAAIDATVRTESATT